MILNAIAENLKRQSKDDFKGRQFEAWLIVQAVEAEGLAIFVFDQICVERSREARVVEFETEVVAALVDCLDQAAPISIRPTKTRWLGAFILRSRLSYDFEQFLVLAPCRGKARKATFLPYGVPEIDERIPGGGLAMEPCMRSQAENPELSTALRRSFSWRDCRTDKGKILWCLPRPALFFPAISQADLHPDPPV